tara:strand:+ start:1190 stop:1762 length:573 start_codon:yes stop_codon:yes gene_type:complete
MSFVTDVNGVVISFAEYTDVVQKDQRLLEANQLRIPAESGFVNVTDFVEDMLIESTTRILLKIKASTWWQAYNNYVGNNITSLSSLPNVNPNYIDPANALGRQQQFTDMCVYYTLKEYLIPLVAQFETESADVAKLEYYERKFNDLFTELLAMADWYDADGDGTVEASEVAYSYAQTRRTRRPSRIVRVR